MKRAHRIVIALLVAWASNAVLAAPVNVSVYTDSVGSLDFDDARVQSYEAVAGSELRYGLSDDIYWVKFEAPEIAQRSQVLYTCNTQLDVVDAYIPDGTGWRVVNTGSSRPFSARDFVCPCFVFDLSAATRPVAYIRIASDPFTHTLWHLIDKDQLALVLEPQQTAYKIYFAYLSVMLLLNFIFFLVFRERVYFYYFGYIGSLGLLLGTMSGFTNQYLWPNATAWADPASIVFGVLAIAFGLIFTKHMTAIKDFSAPVTKIITLYIPLGLLVVVMDFISGAVSLALMAVYLVITLILATLAILISAYNQYRPSYFMVASIALMLPGAIVFYWSAMGWIGQTWLGVNILYLTTAAEATLLAFALAYRDRLVRKLKKTQERMVFEESIVQ